MSAAPPEVAAEVAPEVAAGVVDLDEVVPAELLGDIVGDLVESLFPERPRPFPVPGGEPRSPVSARIRISGGWDGEVRMRLSEPLARRLAEDLLVLPPGSADDADVLDLLGELVNVVGGNVKALLPGENRLSLPQPRLGDLVSSGTAAEGVGPTVTLRWGLEPVQVALVPDLAGPSAPDRVPVAPHTAPTASIAPAPAAPPATTPGDPR